MESNIVERIKQMQKDYRFKVVKEAVLSSISFGVALCVDPEGFLYVVCQDTGNVVVLDTQLRESCMLRLKKIAFNIAVTRQYIVATNWQQGTIDVYGKTGTLLRNVDVAREFAPDMMPSVTALYDEKVVFVDFRSNTLFVTDVKEDGSFSVQKKIQIKKKRFYDPASKTCPCLRALLWWKGNLYVSGEGKIWCINDNGVLEEKESIPFFTKSIVGMIFQESMKGIIDAETNSVCVWKKDQYKKQRFASQSEGRVTRIYSENDHLYLLFNRNNKTVMIKQIAI